MSNLAKEIHELIRSMSPNEKSYVKKTFSNNQKNMVQLFDDLNKIPNFNRKQFMHQHKNRSYMKYISQNCNYLLKSITRSLIDYNAENMTEINILGRLSAISMLVKKGMFSSCIQKINKEIELAESYEYYEYAHKLVRLKERYYKIYLIKEFSYAEHLELAKKKKNYIYQLQLVDKLELLSVMMFSEELAIADKIKLAKSKFVELNLYNKENVAKLPLMTKSAYNYVNYKLSQLKGKPKVAYLKESIIDYNTKPYLKSIYFENYVSSIANYFSVLVIDQDFDLFFEEYDKYLIEIESYPKWKAMDTSPFYFIVKYHLYIEACVKSRTPQKAVKKAKSYYTVLNKNKERLMDSFVHSAAAYIALAFFNTMHIQECLDVVELLKDIESLDAQYFYRSMQIVCHYQLGNMLLVDSLSNSLTSYLRRYGETDKLKDFLNLKGCLLDINCEEFNELEHLPYLDISTLKGKASLKKVS